MESLGPFVREKENNIFNFQNRIAYVFHTNNPNSKKSWYSVADKICRNLEEFLVKDILSTLPTGVPNDLRDRASDLPSMSAEQFIKYFLLPMEDVARCRILCNYDSDLEMMDEQIKTKFTPLARKINAVWREDMRKDKRPESGYRFKTGAHRAVHEYFEVKVDGAAQEISCLIEIQLMTLLQQAWDAKQHVLYEIKRLLEIKEKDAGSVDKDRQDIDLALDGFHALSGLLMIADEFADETWKGFSKDTK